MITVAGRFVSVTDAIASSRSSRITRRLYAPVSASW